MRKELFLLFGIMAFMLVTGSAMAYQQSYYVSSKKTSTSPFDTFGYINITGNNTNCTTITTVYAEFDTNGSYSYRFQLYTNGTLRWTNDFANSGALVCPSSAPIGTWNDTDFTSQGVTAQVVTTNLGVATNVTTHIDMVTTCNTNDGIVQLTKPDYDNTANIFFQTGYNMLSPIEMMSSQIYSNLSNAGDIASQYWLHNTPGRCTNWSSVFMGAFSPPYPNTTQPIWYIPFNSGTGNVTIHMGKYNFGVINHFYLFRPDLNITTDLGAGTSTPNDAFTSLFSLEPNTNYVFIEAWNFVPPIGFQYLSVPFYYVRINDVTSNFSCTFGNCINQTRFVSCIDTKGIYPNTSFSQSCLPNNQTIYLGFEDYSPRVTSECVIGSLCLFAPVDVGYNNPENPHWEILPNSIILYPPNQTKGTLYGGTMTGSESFVVNGTTYHINPISQSWNRGTNFLKLWYEPPFYTHAFYNPNTSSYYCDNTSFGFQSISTLDYINASFLASLNFTFPSNAMSMFVDVRKCPSAPVQYSPPLYCVLSGGQACYGGCTTEPLGNYFLIVLDVTTNEVVLNYNDVSLKENWTTIRMDVSNVINQAHNYRLILGVQPPNGWTYDPNPYCSYFDNVRLFNQGTSSLDDLAIAMFGVTYSELTLDQQNQVNLRYCSPPQQCVGKDLYVNTLVNNICTSKIYSNDAGCVAQEQAQIVTGNQSLFQPIQSVCNQIVNTTTNQTYCDATKASGFGFSLLFLTPIFWLMMLIIVVMTGVSWVTRHMEVGLGSGILLLVGFTLVFPELLFITIAIVVIVGFIVGRTAVKAVVGGG